MYNVKQTEEVLKMMPKGNRGDYIRIARITPENKSMQSSIDIRTMFTCTDPNEGNSIRPTQKGVRISSEMLPELMAVIYANMTEEERIDFTNMCDTLMASMEASEDDEDDEDIIGEDEDAIDVEIED